jgi:predicted Zn-dependent peptidase
MGVDRSRLPQQGPDPHFHFPDIQRHVLDNGLAVRTVEHHSVPVVTFTLQVNGGSGADPAPLEGLAALTTDMLDEGTGRLSAIDVSDALARIGADYDIDVAPDAVALSLTTLARFAGRGAALLADMAVRPSLREDDFTRVRQLRLDRLKQIKDLPPAVAERTFLRLLYASHPYGHLPIGTDASLRRITLDDVVRFHRETFQPDRATLIVVGALGHDALLDAARRAFAGWGKTAGVSETTPPASDIAPPAAAGARLAVVAREAAAQSELRIGLLAARRNTADYAALIVMNAVLGGQFVSRISLKLREEKGFTYGARTGFDWRKGLAPFALQTSVHTAATAEAVQDVFAELAAIRDSRPPSADELALAKASLTRGYPRNFETAQQVARSVSQLSLYGLPDSYFERFTPTIAAVSIEDVVAAARQYVDPSRLTTLIVGDYGAIGPSLDRLELGQPEVLAVES